MSNSHKVWRYAIVASVLMNAFPGSALADPSERMSSPDKEILLRVVRAHRSEVRGCYDDALARDPDVEGRVVIKWVLGPSGKVESSEVEINTTADVRLGECIAMVSKIWEFPESAGELIFYPFLLKQY